MSSPGVSTFESLFKSPKRVPVSAGGNAVTVAMAATATNDSSMMERGFIR
jgi:hypothetical protein